MRVVLAALFVYAGIMLAVVLLSDVMDRVSPLLSGGGLGLLFILLVILAVILFSGSPIKGNFISQEEQIKELEGKGLLTSTDFKAVRAFQVEEFEDEGPHYFIELETGNVLYLNGQYLYDYDLIEDEEYHQPKTFPCTDFTIRRHRIEGYVVDIICRGNVLESESREPEFLRGDYRQNKVPEDGDIITDKSFDEVKRLIRGSH